MTNPQTKPLSKEYTKDKIPRLKNPKRKFFSPTDTLFFAIDINLLNLFSVNIFSIYELREEEKEVSSIPSHIPNIIPIKYAIRNIKKYNIFLNNYYNYFFRDLLQHQQQRRQYHQKQRPNKHSVRNLHRLLQRQWLHIYVQKPLSLKLNIQCQQKLHSPRHSFL